MASWSTGATVPLSPASARVAEAFASSAEEPDKLALASGAGLLRARVMAALANTSSSLIWAVAVGGGAKHDESCSSSHRW